ncbi:ribosomal RNA small subunit methyltransferase A [Steroidobacter denitrificans]|uniref:Ribosomal RNA small subunit methyltransferase A n=1 Tax=Steroidobacter denitrificans TaxID=465721 RepID=A0A127FAT3_STEDE|nr:16S rRNA (adenine(1518)-N(6)/adenine(1519)-N(6))-dimethyltransferase RsmA [Steroidobacter denitrificans]AMN46705.1 ribosomal RNA small subunit methyltransferase A [Steroidobacter denitrificans]
MHRARKRFGQHFLHDSAVVSRILEAIDPRTDDFMVEIGPGLGAITLPLLKRLAELHAIEIDRDAIRHLRERTAWHPGFHLHEADALEFDLSQLRPPQGGGADAGKSGEAALRVVGNLPYNISTPLLFRLIEQRQCIKDMHFMLQKEVVDRMAAPAGSEHYGRLSVMLAPWVAVEPLFDIGPGAFRPPPRVRSTFVRLKPPAAPLDIRHPRQFSTVVAAAFSQRRKTLRNALRALLSSDEILAAGIDPAVRAETLSAADFAALAAQLARKSAAPPSADGHVPPK